MKIHELLSLTKRKKKIDDNDDTETFHQFSIFPKAYEIQLDRKYGIKLRTMQNGQTYESNDYLGDNCLFSESDDPSLEEISEKILNKYEGVPGFCSMRINSEGELMEHVRAIHEVSYRHYIFGKERNMKGKFPNSCCGRSAKNILLTLMKIGYPNSSFFYNGYYDHAYNGLPFLFGDKGESGFIIVDPTSDQLFNDKTRAPRNNTFVVSGVGWKYETDWRHGANLFPNWGDFSTFSNLYTLAKYSKSEIRELGNIGRYFKNVFKNPVDVEIEPF